MTFYEISGLPALAVLSSLIALAWFRRPHEGWLRRKVSAYGALESPLERGQRAGRLMDWLALPCVLILGWIFTFSLDALLRDFDRLYPQGLYLCGPAFWCTALTGLFAGIGGGLCLTLLFKRYALGDEYSIWRKMHSQSAFPDLEQKQSASRKAWWMVSVVLTLMVVWESMLFSAYTRFNLNSLETNDFWGLSHQIHPYTEIQSIQVFNTSRSQWKPACKIRFKDGSFWFNSPGYEWDQSSTVDSALFFGTVLPQVARRSGVAVGPYQPPPSTPPPGGVPPPPAPSPIWAALVAASPWFTLGFLVLYFWLRKTQPAEGDPRLLKYADSPALRQQLKRTELWANVFGFPLIVVFPFLGAITANACMEALQSWLPRGVYLSSPPSVVGYFIGGFLGLFTVMEFSIPVLRHMFKETYAAWQDIPGKGRGHYTPREQLRRMRLPFKLAALLCLGGWMISVLTYTRFTPTGIETHSPIPWWSGVEPYDQILLIRRHYTTGRNPHNEYRIDFNDGSSWDTTAWGRASDDDRAIFEGTVVPLIQAQSGKPIVTAKSSNPWR